MFHVKSELCAFNEKEWKKNQIKFNCTGNVNVYHCVLDDKGRSGEICIEKTWVQPGFCPVYNNDANTIDIIDCEQKYGRCPDVELFSDKIYKYPACINQTYHVDEDFDDVRGDVKNTIPIIHIVGPALGALVLLFLVLLIAVYFIRRRKASHAHQKEENIPLKNDSVRSDFYQTSVYQSGLSIVTDKRFLCLTGKWGCGKTRTAMEICKSITNTRPLVVQDVNDMNKSTQDTCIVFDEVIKEWYDGETFSKAKEKLDAHYQNQKGKDGIIIFTVSTRVWEKMKTYYNQLEVFTDNNDSNCVLDFNNFPFTQTERDGIFYKCMERNHLNANDFKSQTSNTDFIEKIKNPQLHKSSTLGFPEMSALACKNIRFRQSNMFPNLPLVCIKDDLEWLRQSDVSATKFFTLVYMALNNSTLDFKNINRKLARVFESHQSATSDFNEMKSKNSFPEEYVIKGLKSGEYVLQHDVIQQCVLVIYGTYHFSELLQHAPLKCLRGLIKQQSKFKTFIEGVKQEEWKPILYVSEENWELYVKKIKSEEG